MLENILFSMNSTMPLFFIMLLGYVLHRTGFLSDAFVAGANKFVFYVALPVQLYLRHIAEGASYGTRTVSEVCQGTYSMGVIMAFVFGGVLAMALYSYLMNSRSVGLIHSLPLKRQTLFFTQLLTGFAMLTAGNLLVVLVSLLVCGEPGPLLVWLAVVTLAEIFFLALGTLCAMLTGWLLAVPVLYVGINFLVMVVMQLIHWLAELFIFGYQGDGFGSFTLWCTPVVQLVRRLTDPQGVVAEYVGYPVVSADVSPLENGGWQALGIYAAVAVAIIALACIIFSVYSASPPAIGDTSLSAVTIVWNYVGELVFNLLVLVGAVKASDRIVKEMMGL